MQLDPDTSPSEVASSRPEVTGRSRWRMRSRALVHVALLASAAAALVTLQFLHVRVAIHTDVGLGFAGLVLVHLFQRRHTLGRWARQLTRRHPGSLTRLLSSDAVLALVTLNVLVSGIVDWSRGQPTPLPLPAPFGRWHLLSGAVLVVYLAVHVWRRRTRLRRSVIR